ncbi:MAG: NAD-dependent epimerase/dehydratase family protein [Proteobacteria bacterium]|nr:MAG: NAD-dependent epimerase/dehydratase family protein [Pseudomonadota bacterium]
MNQPEKTVLMTGVTGFIGSYLAAAFLQRGTRVIALTRNDTKGERTRAALDTALHQDKAAAESIKFNHQLLVLPYDIENAREHHLALLASVDEVWHCAAEMSFSPRKLESSFQSNVGFTNDLYRLIAQTAEGCRRFFYVSTAYTGGAEAGVKHEVLHHQPQLINPYQVTKWSTEMSLATQVMGGAKLPVTLFRPAVVIGDTRTGYYPGSPFGIYMYFQALRAVKKLGAETLKVDLDLDSVLQLVPIEVLIANAMALSDREHSGVADNLLPLEIYHVTGQAVKNAVTLSSGKRVVNLKVETGQPETTFDFYADKICSWVKRFGNGQIQFDDSKLKSVLGAAYVPTLMGENEFDTLFNWYTEHLNTQTAPGKSDSLWKQQLGLKFIDRVTNKDQKQRIAGYMLRRR